MADQGHWYTDKNGNHYLVKDGETPKEGWERSKRRKMIDGGKYKVDDGDGKGPREVSMEEYDKYEADDDFDLTTDDDFGFDETEDNVADDVNQYFDDIYTEMRKNGIDMGDKQEILQELGANYGLDRDDQEEFMKYMYGENYEQRFTGAKTWGQREKPEIGRGSDEDGTDESAGKSDESIEKSASDNRKELLRQMEGIRDEEKEKEKNLLNEFGNGAITYDEFKKKQKQMRQETQARIDSLYEKLNSGEDGTNGWKPSDEATPAYDAGGFYSINEGDKWELDDGGSVEVRGVDGENVEVVTPNGTKRMTKDRLSDMVKNATKITADANKGSKNENLQNVLSKAGIKTSMDPVVDGENVRLFAYTDSQARRWKEKLEKLGYKAKSSYDQGAYLVNFSLNDSADNQGSDDSWSAENPKYKGFNTSDATNVKVLEEGDEYEDPNTGRKSRLKIIEYTPYGLLRFGRKDRMYGIVGDDYEGGDTHRKGAIVAPSLKSAKEQLKEFTDYYKQEKKR